MNSEIFRPLNRRRLLLALGACCTGASANDRNSFHTRSFQVFGLLRPRCLRIRPAGEARLHIVTANREFALEPRCSYTMDVDAAPVRLAGFAGEPVPFVLEVPGVLKRNYCGTAVVEAVNNLLVPVIEMDVETAVGAIAAAELPLLRCTPDALMAQSIAARSFLAATCKPRHEASWFCDTTHCQFLRAPAKAGSLAGECARLTEGLVLADGPTVLPGCYSAACGGQTEGGMRDGFLYRSVLCEVCRKSGWQRRGHGFGLCQEGAMGMAAEGRSWREILRHYFPSARLMQV